MKKITIAVALTICLVSCKKLVEVSTPQNELTTDKVFTDTTSALAALGTIYGQLDQNLDYNFSVLSDTYVDNLSYTGSSSGELGFYTGNITVSNPNELNIWEYFYRIVYECNDLITQLPLSGKLPTSSVTQLSNEAKFLRAYAYFYLVNLYGDVPLLLTTNVSLNASSTRTSTTKVYQQITADLVAAKNGLSSGYQGGGRVRANSLAASAMLARIYLFQQNWQGAETESTNVISSGVYMLSGSLNNVFLANSEESILQVWNQYGYTSAAAILVTPANTLPVFPVSTSLLNAFEIGDNRKIMWIDTTSVPNGAVNVLYSYYSKDKNREANTSSPEYLTILRLAEQYLIRAEARAEQGKLSGSGGALDDINLIRIRAGLANTTAETQMAILAAIAQERRVELFGEWGSRFLDLKRTGQLTNVMQPYKPTWKETGSLYPIPSNEITYDHNLTQNPGY